MKRHWMALIPSHLIRSLASVVVQLPHPQTGRAEVELAAGSVRLSPLVPRPTHAITRRDLDKPRPRQPTIRPVVAISLQSACNQPAIRPVVAGPQAGPDSCPSHRILPWILLWAGAGSGILTRRSRTSRILGSTASAKARLGVTVVTKLGAVAATTETRLGVRAGVRVGGPACNQVIVTAGGLAHPAARKGGNGSMQAGSRQHAISPAARKGGNGSMQAGSRQHAIR